MPPLLWVPVPAFDQPLDNPVAALALISPPFLLFMLLKDSFHRAPLNRLCVLEAFLPHQPGCCAASTALRGEVGSAASIQGRAYLRASVLLSFVCIFCSVLRLPTAAACLDIFTIYTTQLIWCKSN